MTEEQYMRWFMELANQQYGGKTYNLTDALITNGLM